MTTRTWRVLGTLAAFAAASASAQHRVEMTLVDAKGAGASIGTIELAATKGGGVTLTPMLKGLPPGEHGFHVHEFGNCGPKEKDGKLEAAEMAGGHYDPEKTKAHKGPGGGGHMGDLPVLKVDAQGNATQAVVAPRLALKDLRRKAIVIHAGGDNQSDQPKPNGGGGTRIACGVVGEK